MLSSGACFLTGEVITTKIHRPKRRVSPGKGTPEPGEYLEDPEGMRKLSLGGGWGVRGAHMGCLWNFPIMELRVPSPDALLPCLCLALLLTSEANSTYASLYNTGLTCKPRALGGSGNQYKHVLGMFRRGYHVCLHRVGRVGPE